MKQIRVISKKYDGSLRDEYTGFLVAETSEVIILISLPGSSSYDYRKNAPLATPDGLIEIYFKKRWYDVWHICEQVSNLNVMYINVSLPATLKGDILEWVDLDLDYRVHMDKRVERLDQDEFKENSQRMHYPEHLIEKALSACQDIEKGLNSGMFPFNHQEQVEFYQRLKSSLNQ
jgi:uncharacterized protein